jgi:hypothetical protein
MPVNALAVSCPQHLLRINLEAIAHNPSLKLFREAILAEGAIRHLRNRKPDPGMPSSR